MPEDKGSMRDLLRNRNFKLLWGGEAVSLLGDQFYLIAMPWLVLQLTGDPLAMGAVLALAAVPRALFMLIGGAATDRFSSRGVMLVSTLIRMGLVGTLGALTVTGRIEMALVYGFALAFGLADAFFYPAQTAIVPEVAERDNLQLANTLIQGTMQIANVIGPAAAGTMIALLSLGRAEASITGIGLALLIDAGTFAVSVLTLWMLRLPHTDSEQEAIKGGSMLESIRGGLRFVGRSRVLSVIFIMIALADFTVVGPIAVGIPLLADTRLAGGAASFGSIMSAHGAGALLGLLAINLLPKPRPDQLGTVLSVVWSLLGVSIAVLGITTSTGLIALLMLLAGVVNSYVVVTFITWLQIYTPDAIMGRVMSVLMVASIGLQPLGLALAGVVARFSLSGLFIGGGLLMALMVLSLMLSNPEVRRMTPPAAEPGIEGAAAR